MAFDTSAFSFGRVGFDATADAVAKIPAGIDGKAALLAALRDGLRFPSYFGNNWDALSDCLRDLSWLPQRRVVIQHAGLPRLPEAETTIYLTVLCDSVKSWGLDDDHDLVVAFPQATLAILQTWPNARKITA